MKLNFPSLTIVGTLIALCLINPHEESRYAKHLTYQLHSGICEQSESEFCESLSLFTRPVLKSVIQTSTTSQNRLLFTTFQTHLPCIRVHGVGIAGQYFFRLLIDDYSLLCSQFLAIPMD